MAFVVRCLIVGGKAQGGGVWGCVSGVPGRKAATRFARRQGIRRRLVC